MMNTTQEYISVTSNLTSSRGWFQVVLNYYINGKRKQSWRSLRIKDIPGNKTMAKNKAKEIVRNFEQELNTPKENVECKGSNVLFGNFMLEWLDKIKNTVEETTYASYKNKVPRIVEYFNNKGITLANLKRADIKEFYNYLLQTRNIKTNTIKRYHANIHKCLNEAVELELISVNPASKIQFDKSEQYIASYYNQKELEKLFEVSKGSAIGLHILIASYYGFRRSETCALKWSAIDFLNHTITVSHTVTQCNVDGKYKLVRKNRTKNKSSYRTLPLIPRIEQELLKLKNIQEKQKKLFGNSYKNKDGYILVDAEGNLILPDRVTRTLGEIIKKNNLRKIRFHDLRHSCASLLLANNISMKEIQQWLGHSNFSTTANIYSHLDSKSKIHSANVISNIFCA